MYGKLTEEAWARMVASEATKNEKQGSNTWWNRIAWCLSEIKLPTKWEQN